jgi:hypothetical protein
VENFGYLSVLISIVLGLGITNILGGFARLVRERDRLIMYWPVPIWMATMLLAHVQMWWAMFALRSVTAWTIAAFLTVLMQPIMLYLTSALIVPNTAVDGPIDLKYGFFREIRWFGSGLALMIVTSLSKNFIIYGGVNWWDLGAHALFFTLALSALIVKNEAVHRLVAPAALGLLLTYIGLLFTKLGEFG